MGDDDGPLSVRPAALYRAGQDVDGVRDRHRAAQADLLSDMDDGWSSLRGWCLGPALQQLGAEWERDLCTVAGGLHRSAEGLRLAAQAYGGSDRRSSTVLGRPRW